MVVGCDLDGAVGGDGGRGKGEGALCGGAGRQAAEWVVGGCGELLCLGAGVGGEPGDLWCCRSPIQSQYHACHSQSHPITRPGND